MRVALKGKLLICFAFFVISTPAFSETIVFDTELTSMNMTGEVQMPLGPGYENILTTITFAESVNVPSIGRTTAIGPQGGPYQVESFFDVFFDVTITDTDANHDFPGMTDGASLSFMGNGPARVTNVYSAIFDGGAPNYGLFPPPQSNPYLGFLHFEIPLGADVNGNGEKDKIKFDLGIFTLFDSNRMFTTLPDGTVIDSVNAQLSMEGGVMDLSSDPAFSFTLTGPTTATSRLVANPTVPEPASLMLLGSGLLGLAGLRRKLKK